MENNSDIKVEDKIFSENNSTIDSNIEEHTPKLFSENSSDDSAETDYELKENNYNEQLFDQDNNEEEDFEIPAFLRRQKF